MNPSDSVLRATPVVAPLPDWWRQTAGLRARAATSIARAIALGAHADRLGHAFLGGYASAITALDPSLGPDALGALCATEAGGGHPRAIRTTLTDGKLDGTKHFVSGGPLATVLLVVATTGERDGRPALKVARIAATRPGVQLEEGAALPFVPEVPHGSATFRGAAVDAVLEGDGYDRYLKPFRTIEDLHVFGAVLGCLFANGRAAWPEPVLERMLALLAAISDLAARDPAAPDVHLALAGVLQTARTLIDGLEWKGLDADFVARFERDRPLLNVADRVRAQRRERAWEAVRR